VIYRLQRILTVVRGHPVRSIGAGLLAAVILWLVIPSRPPFPACYSRVVYDAHGALLRATSAPDGQIRFPPMGDSLPRKYVEAVLACEDRRFFRHPGVDPFSLVKSAMVNLRHGRRLRGGSTLTMQVARLSRPKQRTYFNKLIECAAALKLTLHYKKSTILRTYADHVPMGGNTVGIEAASWRYFGKPLAEITWAEAALFAVLPNSPSSINLEKGRVKLKTKRDRALRLLRHRGALDSITCALACREPLPSTQSKIPFEAPHFCLRALGTGQSAVVRTTLDRALQRRAEEIVGIYNKQYAGEGAHNIAALVVSTATGKVAAYVGSQNFDDSAGLGQVDGVAALRSTGSLLKPFLVAKTLDRGPYCMESMLQDVPTFYGSFYPMNASKEYSGLVSMRQMLVQSLNVPAVRLLDWYGVGDFYLDLRHTGMSSLFRPSEGYGLSLILGGAEASLWELTGLFAMLGNFGEVRPFTLYSDTPLRRSSRTDTTRFCSEGAAWLVLSALSELKRPGAEYYWRFFTNQIPVAWKTGTSYGQKDAWAIGVNAQWTIGVWVGNFSGTGNPNLGGAQSAGPVLFQLFEAFSDKSQKLWFDKPEYDLRPVTVCRASGLAPSPDCDDTIQTLTSRSAWKSGVCPYHKRLLLDRRKGFTVCSRCWALVDTVWKVKILYPPSVRSILAGHGYATDTLPRHNPACPVAHPHSGIEILYPVEGVSIVVPRNLQGEYEKVVFKADYDRPGGRLFWYLDGTFIAETAGQHAVAVDLQAGKHRLAVEDVDGAMEKVRFEAFRK
jgi:penicillin-binding protein 1C